MSVCDTCGREAFPKKGAAFGADLCFRLTLPRDPACWKLGYEREKARADKLEHEAGQMADAHGSLNAEFTFAVMRATAAEAQAKADAAKLYELACKLERVEEALRALGRERQFGLCWCNTIAGTYCVGQPQCKAATAALAPAPECAEKASTEGQWGCGKKHLGCHCAQCLAALEGPDLRAMLPVDTAADERIEALRAAQPPEGHPTPAAGHNEPDGYSPGAGLVIDRATGEETPE